MNENQVDLSRFETPYGVGHKLFRLLWSITWTLLARWIPRGMGKGWKNLLLRMFGAKLHRTAHVYSSAKVYYPPFLTMEENSCLADGVNCYNAAPVTIGRNVTVSQEAYLCTASHDITKSDHPQISAPIVLQDQCWVGARAYIGMGVTVGQGAVVGATASVYKDVEPWTVVGGNPAKFIKKRVITD